jgi:hypothetical protein
MKKLLPVLLCAIFFPVMASHIVGGEFEIIHVSGFRYRFNLHVYFDEVNGSQLIKQQDTAVDARIFRVRDNVMMRDVRLRLNPNIPSVPYTQPGCSIGELQTTKMSYTTVIELPPTTFDDPEGYYIVWERCCRNYKITNIQSNDPQTTNLPAAGQTFYLKFPPVVVDGEAFVNSSPELFPPLSDYACINKPYYANFAGTDRDGDSLVYSLVTPLSTHSSVAIPTQILPAPYPEVQWRPGFDLNNVMNGNPDLAISTEGLLTVTPSFLQGLFVFEVLCEEFRDGVKIGEVRRDFQMLVVDCKEASPPVIQGNVNGALLDGNINLTYNFEDPRCITVRVEDPDVFRSNDQFSENVGVRAIPLGFKGDVSEVFVGDVTARLTSANPFIEFPVCFPSCPYKKGGYRIGIITYDDACSLPLLDTLVINVNILPPDNARAQLSPDVKASVFEGTQESWTITGSDADMDDLVAHVIPIGFTFDQIGLTYEQIKLEAGAYEGRLTWDADCEEHDFNIGTDFKVMVVLDDLDTCNFNDPDTMTFDLHVILPDNEPPHLQFDLPPAQVANGVDATVFENVSFGVEGLDFDGDSLTMFMQPVGFSADDYDFTFNDTTNISHVASPFLWLLSCGSVDLQERDEFMFNFLLVEKTKKCQVYDTIAIPITIRLSGPDNTGPQLTMTSLTQTMENNKVTATLGEGISILLHSADPDFDPVDHVWIELIGTDGTLPPAGFVFTPGEGSGSAQATLTWAPDCSIFENNVFENAYTFTFRTFDDRCQNVKGDTVILDLIVKDIDGNDHTFIPPNVVTPNGDGCNDFFAMDGFEYEAPSSADCSTYIIPNLPFDNCIGRFSSIRIYNRWGKQVFESSQRNFKWDASGEAAGVYFYTILYTNPVNEEVSREYKGAISVRY